MRMILLLTVLVAMALASGCCGSLNEEFVRAVDTNWEVMGPGYRAYLEKDEALPEASKKRRLAAVDEFTALVKEAKADVEKNE